MKTAVQCQKTGECEDQHTIDVVLSLCENANIETAGAVNAPVIHIKEYDDGDQGIIVEITAPPQNAVWSKSVYKFIGKLWKRFPYADLYPENKSIDGCLINQYRMDICTHACDPD